MNKKSRRQKISQMLIAGLLLLSNLFVVSCKDDYYYDDREPEWLGESIYEYLASDPDNYSYYVKLIEDVGDYKTVLSRTGSKTLFVAKDEAFERFFQNNEWGVSSYNGLSKAQKNLLLKFGMIDNAYLIELLSNYYDGGLQLGAAMRRSTAVSVFDSISYESGLQLPENEYWDGYRSNGLYLLKDNTSSPMVYFLNRQMEEAGITNEDFSIITGINRESESDEYIFNHKIIDQDITCKNGYIHVLEDVMVPPTNMAEYLTQDAELSQFSKLMERFCAPYYDSEATTNLRQVDPGFTDSLYVKKYFSSESANTYPNSNELIDQNILLPYDPGWNSYSSEFALQADMAAIYAPTDQAMEEYLQAGSGLVLKERYGSWDNVPDDIIALFLRRHMRESFVNSVPSRFGDLKDSENSTIPIKKSDVVDTYTAVNGVVYKTNNVYAPDDFVSVYGPVLFSEKTQVFNWAVRQNEFRLYLNALESRYSFFVPTDEYFKDYIEPVSFGKDVPGALKFWFNTATNDVNATVYSYDIETGIVGDSLTTITNTAFLTNRLLDLLDTHVVVGDVESGNNFYFTKGGNVLYVNGSGENLTVQGGGDIELGKVPGVITKIEQENGNTYFIDKPIQSPLRSVYAVLSQTPEFSMFFDLVSGFPNASSSVIFVKKTNYYGIDFNVKFFNTFNYTVFVPTNDAIQQAIDDGTIHTWDEINAITDIAIRDEYVSQLERFLRYHFQDNSVFVGDQAYSDLEYQTATIKLDDSQTAFNTYKNKYYKLGLNSDGDNLQISTENYGSANVVKDNGLYNILTRDYIFGDNPAKYGEIDGSGAGTNFNNSTIITSSTAVIHQIDNVLKFE